MSVIQTLPLLSSSWELASLQNLCLDLQVFTDVDTMHGDLQMPESYIGFTDAGPIDGDSWEQVFNPVQF